jgi:hypothetical protein
MSIISLVNVSEVVIWSELGHSSNLLEFSIVDRVEITLFEHIKLIFTPPQLQVGPEQTFSCLVERKVAYGLHFDTKLLDLIYFLAKQATTSWLSWKYSLGWTLPIKAISLLLSYFRICFKQTSLKVYWKIVRFIEYFPYFYEGHVENHAEINVFVSSVSEVLGKNTSPWFLSQNKLGYWPFKLW